MMIEVVKGDVHYFCKDEEQLNLFLDAGYEIVEPAEEKATTKTSKTSPRKKTK